MTSRREINAKKKILPILIATVLPLALAACGGGGGGSNTPNWQSSIPPLAPQDGGDSGGNAPTPSVSVQPVYKDASNADRAAHGTGAGVTVGINDTGIDTHNRGLTGANIDPTMFHYAPSTTSNHPGAWSEIDTATVDKQHSVQGDGYYHGTNMAQIAFNTAKGVRLAAADGLGTSATNTVVYEGGEKLSTKAPIVSNSWGTKNTFEGTKQGQRYWADRHLGTEAEAGGNVYKAIVQNGALWLQSTGNNSKHSSNIETLLPLLNPKLEKGFLAVGAVDYPDSTTKEYVANDCGLAAQWCVVAPAVYKSYNQDGTQSTYLGTSNATAYTAAVAALVKGRYNWMTNENLKQVIMGTATDLGAAGVDSVFGWGRVDKDKALGGYGQFSWGNSDLNVTSGTSYFDNNIFGTGGFNKSGAGTLVLNGDNTFTGHSNINEGTLILNGQNKAALTVAANGQLTVGDNTTGISSGNVENNGVINAESAQDYHINGDYTQTSTGTLNKYLGSKLDITGVASLAGNLNITGKVVGYVTHTGTDYSILTADNGVTGTFNNVAFTSALLDGTIGYGTNSVYANLIRSDAVSAGATGQSYSNRANAASQIDQVLNVLDNNYANGTLTASQMGFYQSMVAPNSATALNKQVFNLDRSIYNNNLYNASLESLESNKFLAAQLTQNKDGVWVNYRYSNARTQFDGMNGKKNNNTVDIGATKTLGDTQTIGAQFSIGDENWTDKFQGLSHESDTDKYNLSIAYNKRIKDINIYGIANYAWLDSKIKSDINEKIDGKQYGFGLGVNKQFDLKNSFYVTPDLMVQYLNTTGDDVQGVVYDAKTKQVVASFTVTLGYRINKDWSVYAKAGVDRDVQQDNTSVNEYVGVRVDNSVDLPKTRYSSRLGIAYRPTDKLEVGAEYHYSGSNHWNENAANVYLKYKS